MFDLCVFRLGAAFADRLERYFLGYLGHAVFEGVENPDQGKFKFIVLDQRFGERCAIRGWGGMAAGERWGCRRAPRVKWVRRDALTVCRGARKRRGSLREHFFGNHYGQLVLFLFGYHAIVVPFSRSIRPSNREKCSCRTAGVVSLLTSDSSSPSSGPAALTGPDSPRPAIPPAALTQDCQPSHPCAQTQPFFGAPPASNQSSRCPRLMS